MITAKLGNGIINCFDSRYSSEILREWAKKKIILCPACGMPYEYCHGEVKNQYFRHKDKQKCEDKYSEPETEEHAKGKLLLYNWIRSMNNITNVVLEGWLPETKQRPDIMFKHNDKQYVIEYQATPISSEYIKRHELYQAAGINDIWILGTDNYLEKSEMGKKFKLKEIENHTNYYLDSQFGIFIVRDYEPHFNDYIQYVPMGDRGYFLKEFRKKMNLRHMYENSLSDYRYGSNETIFNKHLFFTGMHNFCFADIINDYL